MPSPISSFFPVTVADYVQLGCIAVVVYLVLRLVRGTIAASILRGAVLMIAVGLVGLAFLLRVAELGVLERILTLLLYGLALVLLIVFQPELRRGLLALGEQKFFDRFRPAPKSCAGDLTRAIENLARERHGALFAIERRNALNHIVATGIQIDARATPQLLAAIFWPGAPLHDGGVVIRGNRAVAAGCIFPLAQRRDISARLGTRHRAGIGLAEESDAVIVIVSEETGDVSVAVGSELRRMAKPSDVAAMIDDLLGTLDPTQSQSFPVPVIDGDADEDEDEERGDDAPEQPGEEQPQ